MNIFTPYSRPTAEFLLSLLEKSYQDQIKMDRILDQVSREVLKEYKKLIKDLEKDGRIYLDKEVPIRNYPNIYKELKEIERREWDNLMERAWIWMMASTEEAMKRSYKETYIFTIQLFSSALPPGRQVDIKNNIKITDTYITEKVLKIPWCQDGKVYSQRLYGNVANFQKKLNFVLEQGVVKGKGMEWMEQAWRKLTHSSASATARLLKTETVAMWSKATKEAYLDMGIEYVEIIGDAACGEVCVDFVGEVLELREAELGDELPPYHPNCACSYIAYEEGQE